MNKFLKSLSTLGFVVAASAVLLGPVNAQANNTPFFNSNTSNGNVGNETDFLRIGDINGASTIEACTDGTVIDLWAYVHNNAATVNNGDNFDGPGIAENTSLKLNVDQNSPKNSHTVSAVVNASNASAVTDAVTITCGDREVSLEYVGVSNVFSTSPTVDGLGDFSLDGDPINGATIGYNGRFPGCNEYRASVTMQVRVVVDEPEEPQEEITLECVVLEPILINKEKREYTLEVTGNATVTNGENNVVVASSKINISGPSTNASFDGPKVNYAFTNDGTYVVSGVVNFERNGEVVGTADDCSFTITFESEQPPVVTENPTEDETTVAELPDTGPATNIALFAAIVAASSFAYRKYAALRS